MTLCLFIVFMNKDTRESTMQAEEQSLSSTSTATHMDVKKRKKFYAKPTIKIKN